MKKELFISLVVVLSIPLPALAQQPTERPFKADKPMEIRALQFQTLTSPQGRFTVSIPIGWAYKPLAPDESSIGFTPEGKPHPEVSIAFRVTDVWLLAVQAFGWQFQS